MNEFSSCTKCSFETADPATFCRQCGGRMVASARIRKLGRFSVVVGAFLVVMMLFVIFFEARAMLPGSDTRYTGTHAQAVLMFLLEGDVAVFGAVSAFAGLWQIKHGKRNKKLFFLVIGLAVVAVLLGLAFNNVGPKEEIKLKPNQGFKHSWLPPPSAPLPSHSSRRKWPAPSHPWHADKCVYFERSEKSLSLRET